MRKLYILALILFGLHQSGFASLGPYSVSIDTANANDAASGTSITDTITIGNFMNRALVVTVEKDNNTAVTSITGAGAVWISTPMGMTAGPTTNSMEIWCGVNPSSGSQTVTVNFSPAMTGFTFININSLYDVNQSSPCISYKGNNVNNASNVALNIQTKPNDAALGGMLDVSGNVAVNGCTTTIASKFQTGGAEEGLSVFCVASSGTSTFGFVNSNGKVDAGVDVQAAPYPAFWMRTKKEGKNEDYKVHLDTVVAVSHFCGGYGYGQSGWDSDRAEYIEPDGLAGKALGDSSIGARYAEADRRVK